MADPFPIRRCLISVYDKTGIVDFARVLHGEFGVEILSTGGTAKALRDAGVPVTLIEDITGCPELLDGRVKTLHPAIHAAILADRGNPEHMRQLDAHGIKPIDIVVVNLYPFEQTVADPNCTFEQAIEMIDIGGVALLRAAAKNHRYVLPLVGPAVFGGAIGRLRDLSRGDPIDEAFRMHCALDAVRTTAQYDARITTWLGSRGESLPATDFLELNKVGDFRYGENPHQSAEFRCVGPTADGVLSLADNPEATFGACGLSHNNTLDADAALGLCAELARARKHTGEATLASGHAEAPSSRAHGGLRRRSSPGGDAPRFSTRAPEMRERVAPRITAEQWSQRRLPHLQVPAATYFVTFRLDTGELTPAERDIVLSACTHWHTRRMTVHCVCVMPDHVHMLMTPHEVGADEWASLGELLHSIKRFSAQEINRLRGAAGRVWQAERFDRVMRNCDEFLETWHYIEANPVTAGIIADLPYLWFWRSDAGFQERLIGADEVQPGLETRANRGRLETGPTDSSRANRGRLETGPTDQTGPIDQTGPTDQTGPATAHACVFIKHTNACGAAVHVDPVVAYRNAYLGDPNAAMGGILAVDFVVDAAFAAIVMETYARFGKPLKDAGAAFAPGGFFVEVWVAPRFTRDAVAVIRGTYDAGGATPEPGEARLGVDGAPAAAVKEWGQRVRLLGVGDMTVEPDPAARVYRSIAGGMLVQTPDSLGLNEEQWRVVTKRAPTEAEMDDLRLAWLVCKHTKSNAITICRDGMMLGNGAGQMSRVMSCRIATWLARENGHVEGRHAVTQAGRHEQSDQNPDREGGARGADSLEQGAARSAPVAASDAFFPFADGPRVLIDAGVAALIQPGGGKRDQDVIDLCDERGVAMVFTGTRHFRH